MGNQSVIPQAGDYTQNPGTLVNECNRDVTPIERLPGDY
jgi:hypothetical protein